MEEELSTLKWKTGNPCPCLPRPLEAIYHKDLERMPPNCNLTSPPRTHFPDLQKLLSLRRKP